MQAAAAVATGEAVDGSSPGLAGDVTNLPKEDGSEDLVLLVEHTPTYTNGRRNRGAQGISDQEAARLQGLGAVYVESLRGGEITFHGPGQLVAYPILDLKPIKVNSISNNCWLFLFHSGQTLQKLTQTPASFIRTR